MKKLLSLLAVTALLTVTANAEVLKNVNLKGEIQTIASDVHHNAVVGVDALGNDIYGYNSGTSARVLAGLSADLVEDVTANLMFQYANVWGNDASTGKTVQNYWDDIHLVEANVVLHNLFCCLEATVGRQFYGDEDSAVMYFGPNHYNAEWNGLTNSLDAVKIAYSDDVKSLTLIAGRIKIVDDELADPAILAIDEADATLIGADFKLNLTDALKLQVYGYNINDLEFTDTLATVYPVDGNGGFYGAKLAFDPEDGVRLAAEYARNYGFYNQLFKEGKDTGHMAKLDVAMDIDAITARGTALYANENFWAFGNYTPGLLIGHPLAGDIFDYTDEDGVTMFNIGFDVKPADKWTVSLDGYSFQDHRMKHSATFEGDVTVKYDHNEYVQLFAGAGYAKMTAWDGTEYTKANYGSDNFKGQLGMLIKF